MIPVSHDAYVDEPVLNIEWFPEFARMDNRVQRYLRGA